MPLPPLREEDLEMLILGDVYRHLESADRLPADILKAETLDGDTGLVEKHELLAPGAVTLHGEGLVLESVASPDTLAKAHIRHECRACASCLTGNGHRCVRGPLLSRLAVLEWTDDDVKSFRELKTRIQVLFRRWEKMGLLLRKPPVTWKDGYHSTADENRDTWAAHFTPKGIELARERIPGTEYAKGPKSLLWSMTPANRAKCPDWAKDEYRAEGGTLG